MKRFGITAMALALLLLAGTAGAAEQAPAETTAAAEEEVVTVTAEMMIPQDEISFLVMEDSQLHSLLSLDQEKIGVQFRVDRINTEKTVAMLEGLNGKELATVEYAGVGDQVQALYDREVDAILFSETYRQMIEEEYPELEDETRVVYTFGFDILAEDEEVAEETSVDFSVDPFIVYFSGIDAYGTTAARGRSDVNIMAVVNPSTRQILLVSTPRDYYVELPVAGNAMDKLTHAGVYGVEASMETLEYLYDVDINYYVRVNFSGFMQIIDALEGVDVYSSQAFTGEVYGVHFDKGMNHVNGREALSFVRERHSFSNGDDQRQENQLAMVKAVMDKVMSPSILMNYTRLLDSIPKAFNTGMTYDELTGMLSVYLFGGDWNVKTYRVTGEGARRTTYSMGSRSLYVELQNDASIAKAKELMGIVRDGGILPDAE